MTTSPTGAEELLPDLAAETRPEDRVDAPGEHHRSDTEVDEEADGAEAALDTDNPRRPQ